MFWSQVNRALERYNTPRRPALTAKREKSTFPGPPSMAAMAFPVTTGLRSARMLEMTTKNRIKQMRSICLRA